MRYGDVRHSPLALWPGTANGANTYGDISGNGRTLTTSANSAYVAPLVPGMLGFDCGRTGQPATRTDAAFALSGAMTIGGTLRIAANTSLTAPRVLARYGAAAYNSVTQADNDQWSFELIGGRLRWSQKAGLGVRAIYETSYAITPGLPTIVAARRRVVGLSHFVDFFMNDRLVETSTALAPPDGGANGILRVVGATSAGTEAVTETVLCNIGVWSSALTDDQVIDWHEYIYEPELGPRPNTTRYKGTPVYFFPFQGGSIADSGPNTFAASWSKNAKYTSLGWEEDGVFLDCNSAPTIRNSISIPASALLQIVGDLYFSARVVDANLNQAVGEAAIVEQTTYGVAPGPTGPATPSNANRLYGLSLVTINTLDFSGLVTPSSDYVFDANAAGASARASLRLSGAAGAPQFIEAVRVSGAVNGRLNGDLDGETYTPAAAPTTSASIHVFGGNRTGASSGGFAMSRAALFTSLTANHRLVNANLALGCDETPPTLEDEVPANGAIGAPQTGFSGRVEDLETAVWPETFAIYVDFGGGEVLVYDAAGAGFQVGYSGSVTPGNFDISFVVTPDALFPAGQLIIARVTGEDYQGNAFDLSWSFTTASSIVFLAVTGPDFTGAPVDTTAGGQAVRFLARDASVIDTSQDRTLRGISLPSGWVLNSGIATPSRDTGLILSTGSALGADAELELPSFVAFDASILWRPIEPLSGLATLLRMRYTVGSNYAQVLIVLGAGPDDQNVLVQASVTNGSRVIVGDAFWTRYTAATQDQFLRVARADTRVWAYLNDHLILSTDAFVEGTGVMTFYLENTGRARVRARLRDFVIRSNAWINGRLIDDSKVYAKRVTGLVPQATLAEAGPATYGVFGLFGTTTSVDAFTYTDPRLRQLSLNAGATFSLDDPEEL